jgi:hypothetical protein
MPEQHSIATASNPVSPKIVASSVGGALATIIWIVVGALMPRTFSDAQVTALTGATATVLAFAFGYLATDPFGSTSRSGRRGRRRARTSR